MGLLVRTIVILLFAAASVAVGTLGYVDWMLGDAVTGAICLVGGPCAFVATCVVWASPAFTHDDMIDQSVGQIHSRMEGECEVDGQKQGRYVLELGEHAFVLETSDIPRHMMPYSRVRSVDVAEKALVVDVDFLGKCCFSSTNRLRMRSAHDFLSEKARAA